MLKPQFLCQSVLQKLPHGYFLLLIFVLLDTMDSLQYSANASAHSRLNKAKAGLDPIVFPCRLQNLVAVISIAFPFLKWKLVFSGRAGEQKTNKAPKVQQLSTAHNSEESQVHLLTTGFKLKIQEHF